LGLHKTYTNIYAAIKVDLPLLFCSFIISLVRRWLKTQAAAEMGAENKAMLPTSAEIGWYTTATAWRCGGFENRLTITGVKLINKC
jgi:hypothetical protein